MNDSNKIIKIRERKHNIHASRGTYNFPTFPNIINANVSMFFTTQPIFFKGNKQYF